MPKINSRQKGARSQTTGQFVPKGNKFVERDDLIYCYNANEELLFFTDETAVLKHSWCKFAKGYASTHIKGEQVPVHRFVSSPQRDQLVDHINRDKKDNRRCNLRNTYKGENAFNSKLRTNNTSGRAGVWYRKDTNRWSAEIKVNYKKIPLGCFATKEEAISAREDAEEKYYGYKLS